MIRSWNTVFFFFKWWLFTLTLSLRMFVWMLNLLHDKLKAVPICLWIYMINVKDKQKSWWTRVELMIKNKGGGLMPCGMGEGQKVELKDVTLYKHDRHTQLFPKTALKYVLAQHASLPSSGTMPCLKKEERSPKCFPSYWLCKTRPMSQTGLSRPLPWFPHWQEQLKKREGVSHVTRGKFLHHVILLVLVNTQEVI